MEIKTDEHGQIVLKKVFWPLIIENDRGDRLVIVQRDDEFELSVAGKQKWYRANMSTGEVYDVHLAVSEPSVRALFESFNPSISTERDLNGNYTNSDVHNLWIGFKNWLLREKER